MMEEKENFPLYVISPDKADKEETRNMVSELADSMCNLQLEDPVWFQYYTIVTGRRILKPSPLILTKKFVQHPWEQFYYAGYMGDEKDDSKKQTVFSSCDLGHIIRFREESRKLWKDKKKMMNNVKEKRETNNCSVLVPSVTYAFYSVIAKRESVNGLILTPVFNEVVADDRLDLRLVLFNNNARDTLNIGKVDINDHHIGDVFCVTRLQRAGKSGLSIDGLKLEDVACPDGKYYWEVCEFTTMQRSIQHNVITTPFQQSKGGFLCVASTFSRVVDMKKDVTPKGTKIDSILTATILKPLIIPGQFLSSMTSQTRHEVMKKSLIPLRMEEISPIALRANHAPAHVKQIFGKSTSAFKSFSRDEAYKALQLVIEHGSNGVYAIKNMMTDTVPYPTKIESYSIKNPYIYIIFSLKGIKVAPPFEKWNRSARIVIEYGSKTIMADIMTAKKEKLTIHVKAKGIAQDGEEELYKTMKNEVVIIRQKPEMKPNRIKYKIPKDSNADKLVQALNGGKPLIMADVKPIENIRFGKMALLETQTKYAQLMADRRTTALVGSSSFGCGKTVTIAAAALHCSQQDPKKFQMVTAVTNCAVVAVVEKLHQLDPSARIVRIISQENMQEIQPELLTKHDYPKLLIEVLEKELNGDDYDNDEKTIREMLFYLRMNTKKNMKQFLNSEKRKKLYENAKDYSSGTLLKVFMKSKNPKIIVGTVQSIVNAFGGCWQKHSEAVSTIQIDEASTLSREVLLHMAITFPHARMSLVGDHRQLAPFCEREASKLLKNSSVGNILEDCTKKNFPSVFFNGVFRCRAEITELLSELFYDSKLVSLHIKADTEKKLTNFPLQIIHKYPMVFIDIEKTKQIEVGKSMKNPEEAKMAMKLADELSKFVKKSDIAILCFYKAQLNEFNQWSQKSGIYVGSVDSGQGREWPICIICTSRTMSISRCQFMFENRRVNVALSRSRHLNFVFGQKSGLGSVNNWKRIVEKCQEEDALITKTDFESALNKRFTHARRRKN